MSHKFSFDLEHIKFMLKDILLYVIYGWILSLNYALHLSIFNIYAFIHYTGLIVIAL